MLCLLCTPALAQSSPSAAQYQGGGSGYCPPSSTCIQSLADGADDFSENAERGTGAVNDAMADASAADTSAVSGDASAPAAASSSAGSPAAYEDGGPDGITSLPETGGAPFAALGSGILLAALGLIARRIVR